jgi:TIR domain/Restriction endonuclease
MSKFEHNLKPKPQIFVSYSMSDSVVAKAIVDRLRSHGLNVWMDIDRVHPGDNIAESIREAISASAYFLLLLSKNSIDSHWLDYERDNFLKELQSRDITLLPVLLDGCDLPSSLSMYEWFDLRNGIENNLERLSESLKSALEIDFKKLSSQTFQKLAIDLLQKLGFVNIQLEVKLNNEKYVRYADAIVEFRQKDPFGTEILDIYVVELKLYQNSRADLETIRQLKQIAEDYPNATKALLVTTGNLTSVALDWVSETSKNSRIPIHVIDGTSLKRLLLQHTDLIPKYFSPSLATAV